MVNPYKKFIQKKTTSKNFSRPDGAGNYDNMDDVNIVQSVNTRQGTIQHTPTGNEDIVNKKFVDDEQGNHYIGNHKDVTSGAAVMGILHTTSDQGPQIQLSYGERDRGGYLRGMGYSNTTSELLLSNGMYLKNNGWNAKSPNGSAIIFKGDGSIRLYGKTGLTIGDTGFNLEPAMQFWGTGNVSIGYNAADIGKEFSVKGDTLLSGQVNCSGAVVFKQITDDSAPNDSVFVSGASIYHKDNSGTNHKLD